MMKNEFNSTKVSFWCLNVYLNCQGLNNVL